MSVRAEAEVRREMEKQKGRNGEETYGILKNYKKREGAREKKRGEKRTEREKNKETDSDGERVRDRDRQSETETDRESARRGEGESVSAVLNSW